MGILKAIIILPGSVIVFIPAAIICASLETKWAPLYPPATLSLLVFSSLSLLLGFTLAIVTVKLFKIKGGGGTPAPWKPINNLIIEGPYKLVRNPMLLGVYFILFGMAVFLSSWPIFIWLVVFFAGYNTYTVFKEEPELQERYGKSYLQYKEGVPRWIPRITPYQG